MMLKKEDIEALEQRYRTTFINSLAGFRQAVLVGTQSKEGYNNLAIFNSLIHLGANPALFGLINRPDSVQRDTLQNIIDTKEYTLNYVYAADYKKAHQTSARYDKGVSEFEQVGFDPIFKAPCKAPFVEQAAVKIAMQLQDIIPIPANGTILIVGSIMEVDLDATLIGNDGFVALSDAEILISQGLDAYFTSKPLGRLPYAKPTNTTI
jgi:flavin reductase (DIM6/NTAB) family NADH-FMN oxidoreductase RutF